MLFIIHNMHKPDIIKQAGLFFLSLLLGNLKHVLVNVYTLAFMEQLGNRNF